MEQQNEQSNFAPRFRLTSGERDTSLAESWPTQANEPSVLSVPSDNIARANVAILDDYREPARAFVEPRPIAGLYRDHTNPHLARALDLLEEGHRALTRALEASSEGDAIASDDAVQAMQAMLPELFLCRDLGEGYAAVIAGLHFVFENRHGEPLAHDQIRTLERVVQDLHTSPFMPVTVAYGALGRLEEHDLIVTPKSLSCLFDD